VAEFWTLGDITHHYIMKRPRTIWLVLLMAAVFVYWLPIPQTATRIPIGDISSIRGATTVATFAPYDRYFIHENYFPHISIPSAKASAESE